MKKVLLVVLALLISVAFVTTVFAQGTKVGTETKPAEKGPAPKDTGAPSVTKAGPAVSAGAAKPLMFKGAIVSMDDAAKTIVVKDKKGEKTFDISMAKNMPKVKAGDQVSFNYVEKDGKLMAGNFYKKGAKAPAKTEATAISTGAQAAGEAKPAPAKPAPAPAPAK
jgi:Cu/Ag efflux protein CusF